MLNMALFVVFLSTTLLISGCSKKESPAAGGASRVNAFPSSDLTRSAAETMLNANLANPHIIQLKFTHDGAEKAHLAGIIFDDPNAEVARVEFHFTRKGINLLHGLVTNQTLVKLNGKVPPEAIEMWFEFPIESGIAEKVGQITGIVIGNDSSKREVEYETLYVLPEGAEEIRNYIYVGRRAKQSFQRYDDGWRPVE